MQHLKISEEVASYMIRMNYRMDKTTGCSDMNSVQANLFAERMMLAIREKGVEYCLLNYDKIVYNSRKRFGWSIYTYDTPLANSSAVVTPAPAQVISTRRTREETVGKKLLILIDEVLKNAYDAGIYKLEHHPSLSSSQRYRYVGNRKDVLALLRGPYGIHFLDYEDSSLSNAISIRVRCRGVAPTA
jgi:hypothetical protein